MVSASIGKSQSEMLAAAARAVASRKKPERRERTPKLSSAETAILEPTDAQKAGAKFELLDIVDKRAGGTSVTIGKAYRRRPMIEILGDQGVISERELKALRHYRHHADIADRSPMRDSLDKQRGGSGNGPTIEVLNATRVRDDCERAAGVLVDILRAVVVYDVSLSQWAVGNFGSIEVARAGRVKPCVQPTKFGLDLARRHFQYAASRIEADIDARRI